MQTQHPLLQKLETVSSLPSPPQVALKIVEITRDPDKGTSELAEVLRSDAAISAKILQVSNSTAYARSREVTTLSDACNLLGTKSVSLISLGFSLKQSMPDFKVGELDQDILWKHSVATAVVARSVSRFIGQGRDELAFMCGLMSRIGQLVFLSAIPEEYTPVVANVASVLPTAAEEQEALGVTHHKAARMLLDKWQLPAAIGDAVEHWGDPDAAELSEEVEQLINILQVADAARALIFDDEKGVCLGTMHNIADQKCGITTSEMDRIFTACQQELHETLQVFTDDSGSEVSCQQILDLARDQIVQVSVQLATDLSTSMNRCEDLSQTNKELEKQSTTDALTGLSNRFALDRELMKLDAAADSSGRDRPYSIVMIDIDKFKVLNDTYGHDAGDQVLQAVGAALSECSRATDFVARYGGEEFTVLLPNCGPSEASAVADRFRASVGNRGIELEDRTLSVTASAGVASSSKGVHFKSVLKRADAALYEAKQNGRNRTVQDEDDCRIVTKGE